MTRTRQFGREILSAKDMVQRIEPTRQNESFAPLPWPTGASPYRLPLGSVITDPTDTLVMHVTGDSGGVKDPNPEIMVAKAMTADMTANRVNLLYHVGDVVYFNGDATEYFPQFYEPFESYTIPIFAIPGNHDGDNSDNPSVRSLDAFVRNFCSPTPMLTADAKDVDRDAMTQPNVYWTLECELATIIGLWSNVPSGGEIHPDQEAWLHAELAAAPTDRALIVALHHPPFSADAHHGGSKNMGDLLDAAFAAQNRVPDMVLAGHVHNYQRFSRTVADKPITYVVTGAGGYHNLHDMAPNIGVLPWTVPGLDVTLEAFEARNYGFMRLAISKSEISGTYIAVNKITGSPIQVDTFTIPIPGK